MLKRPDTFSPLDDIAAIESLDQAGLVLHELAWIGQQLAKVTADAKTRIDQIKAAAPPCIEIAGSETLLTDRSKLLSELLSSWTAEHIAEYLTGKKRSIDLPHGKLGLRQQPQIVELAEGWAESAVLAAIDEVSGIVATITGILDKKSGIGSARIRDLLDIEVKVSCKSARDAIEAQRVTADELLQLGLVVREAYDEPVVTPSKTVILAE